MKVCNTKTQAQYNKLMKAMEDLGWNPYFPNGDDWGAHKSKTSVELEDRWAVGHVGNGMYEEYITLPEALEYLEQFKDRPGNEPERTEITWDNLKVGDILVNSDNDEITLVFKAGPIWFHIEENGWSSYDTVEEFKKERYTIKQPSDKPERSVEDILEDLSTQDKEIIKKALKWKTHSN